jgi:excisionase family DNA binding protein
VATLEIFRVLPAKPVTEGTIEPEKALGTEYFLTVKLKVILGENMAKIKETTRKPATKKPLPATKKKTPAEKKPIEDKVVPNDTSEKRSTMTTDEVAKYLGVTNGRVSQLKRDGVITPLPPGNRKEGDFYKPLETFIKLSRFYRELSDSRRSGDSEEMAAEKIKQISAKRKLEELKLAQMEGELHKAEDIEIIIGAMLTRLRINLLGIPMGLAPVLREMDNTIEIAEKLDKRIRRVMNEVADMDLKKLVKSKNLLLEKT